MFFSGMFGLSMADAASISPLLIPETVQHSCDRCYSIVGTVASYAEGLVIARPVFECMSMGVTLLSSRDMGEDMII